MKIFAQKCSNDELGLTMIFLWQDYICFPALGHLEEFIELLRDLGAKVNKCG